MLFRIESPAMQDELQDDMHRMHTQGHIHSESFHTRHTGNRCVACGNFRRSDVRACPKCLDTCGGAACQDYLVPYAGASGGASLPASTRDSADNHTTVSWVQGQNEETKHLGPTPGSSLDVLSQSALDHYHDMPLEHDPGAQDDAQDYAQDGAATNSVCGREEGLWSDESGMDESGIDESGMDHDDVCDLFLLKEDDIPLSKIAGRGWPSSPAAHARPPAARRYGALNQQTAAMRELEEGMGKMQLDNSDDKGCDEAAAGKHVVRAPAAFRTVYIRAHIHTHTDPYVYMCICVCMYTDVCIQSIYVYMHTCIHVWCACMCMCVCVSRYLHACTHACTHTH